jgi:hypothetical protein
MAHKVIVSQKNYVPQFLKQRDINSYNGLRCGAAWLHVSAPACTAGPSSSLSLHQKRMDKRSDIVLETKPKKTFWYRPRICLIENRLFRFGPESAPLEQIKLSLSIRKNSGTNPHVLVSFLLRYRNFCGTFLERLFLYCFDVVVSAGIYLLPRAREVPSTGRQASDIWTYEELSEEQYCNVRVL